MANEGASTAIDRTDLTAPSVILGATCFLIHLLVNNRYGVFSDELYFIICGQHPAIGYVDQPPLVPFIAGASNALFGPALLPLRLVPALSMSGTVALSCALTRLLGGRRFAQWLCGLCTLLAGVYLVDGLLLTTDMMQPLTWLGCSWCLVRLMQSNDERWWLGFGAVAGVGLLSKYLILFYIAGLMLGVVATPLRASLLRPWIYAGAAIALLFLAPSAYWQAQHGWPFLDVGGAGVNGKNLALSPLAFFGQQVLFVGPAAVPVWLAGLWRFSVRPEPPSLRVFPIAYAAMVAMFYMLHGKAYYLAPVYPVLLAGGAAGIEVWLSRAALRAIAIGIVTIVGLLLVPLELPVLPPSDYGAYARALGLPSNAAATERGTQSVLPLHLAGMIGWPEMAQAVVVAYRALPPDERRNAVFYGQVYGEAAAIEIYGGQLGGPPAVAGHNNFYLWGPGDRSGSVVITLGTNVTPLMNNYRDHQIVGRINTPYAMPYETNIAIYVLRNPRVPLSVLWPQLKHFD
jgi:4-amino-4-deoxy-L-arabinose transferase-like glycosyltransferase